MFGLGMVGDLIAHGYLRFERERITLFSNPITFIPLKIIVRIVDAAQKTDYSSAIYRACRDETIEWLKVMIENYKLKENEVIDWGLKIESFSGWGNVVVRDIKPETKQVISEILESSVAKEYKKMFGTSKYAVDDILRGLHAGASTVVHHAEMEAFESSCKAKCDPSCILLIKKRELFDFKNPEVVRQIGLKR